MGMGDEDMTHRFAAHCFKQYGKMGIIIRPRIDDGDLRPAQLRRQRQML